MQWVGQPWFRYKNESTNFYAFGNTKTVGVKGEVIADVEINRLTGKQIQILTVEDDVQSCYLTAGRTWINLPYITCSKIRNTLRIQHTNDELVTCVRIISRRKILNENRQRM